MIRPRRIEYEFAGFKDNESYHYWSCYAKELEKYADHLEAKQVAPCDEKQQIKKRDISKILVDIEKMPGYEFKEGFMGVKSVTEGKVFNKYFEMIDNEYPACKAHGAILLIAIRQDGEIWRCRELGCEEGCFIPKNPF